MPIPKDLTPTVEHVFTYMDRKIGEVERKVDTLVERTDRFSQVLEAMARLEAQFAAHLENSDEYRDSLRRVHERLDGNQEMIKGYAKGVHDEINVTTKAIFERIESDRKDILIQIEKEKDAYHTRFVPIERTVHEQHGALRLATFVIPIILTITMGAMGVMFTQILKPYEQASVAANEARITNERQDVRISNLEKSK